MKIYLYCSNFEDAGYDLGKCCLSCHDEWDYEGGGWPMERCPVDKNGNEQYLDSRYYSCFCCGITEWLDGLSPQENRKAFAKAIKDSRGLHE